MYDFVVFISKCFSSLITLLSSYTFRLGSYYFSIWHILLGLLLTSMLISIFWKGARG